ncbi:ATP-dependent helicase HrpB [Moritella sp. Urea-trap-13]|uniref:ATP-dependent helicase HrpB n=1 Tax=Moritella sp. Urea-trap-13 TaxID=2058327 RepID=UPI000C348AF6|nr:ATP-dependent helicase HrpB [Moritella sp. Urea-trap-13]PKH09654.1 ATP-dependent helicase HrpB [Moritella sp. Urea-trap-13]
MAALPITSVLADLFTALTSSNQVILQAPPGAGKSTLLPLKLLQENIFSGRILMLEPRRLAARNIATYMASQLQQKVGEDVGYRMRGDTKVSKSTRLEVVTEGILTRMIQQDPELSDYDLIIFDEFHERSLNADIGLAFALEVQQGLRDDLKLLVMSATLDSAGLQKMLPDAQLLTAEGRCFPVTYSYHPVDLKRSTIKQALPGAIAATVKLALQQQDGNILVFLPGVSEIKRCQQQLQELVNARLHVLPLYGQLTQQQQQAAINPLAAGQRKVVLATNIAETSLTIEGISVVIDSGLERKVSFSPRSGVSRLQTKRISQASATQRAGRAGRLQVGHCYRLWREEDHSRLEPQIEPEILAADLTSTCLELKVWGVNSFAELALLDQPSQANVDYAEGLLTDLGALASGNCSKHGQALAAFGMSPRLAHMLLTAQTWEDELPGISWLACRLIALLEGSERLPLDLDFGLQQMAAGHFKQAQRQAQQWAQRFSFIKSSSHTSNNSADTNAYTGLLLALAYPDRIAQRRDNTGRGQAGHGSDVPYMLSNGLGVKLMNDASLTSAELMVVADLSLTEQGADAMVYNACAIDLAELQTWLPQLFSQQAFVEWDLKAQKLIAEQRQCLGKLVLSRKVLTDITPAQKQTAVLAGIRKAGLSVLPWNEQNKALLTRLRCAHQWLPELGFVDYSETALIADLENWLLPYLTGVTGPAQMKKIPLTDALLSRLEWSLQQRLDKELPTHFTVPTGSKIKLRYHDNNAPSLPVRIQEMFGQANKPAVANGRVPIVIELLSPAQRPLQITQDLLGFWSGSYNDVKKEMKGRYPKHYWPDNPLEAMPTRRVKKHM